MGSVSTLLGTHLFRVIYRAASVTSSFLLPRGAERAVQALPPCGPAGKISGFGRGRAGVGSVAGARCAPRRRNGLFPADAGVGRGGQGGGRAGREGAPASPCSRRGAEGGVRPPKRMEHFLAESPTGAEETTYTLPPAAPFTLVASRTVRTYRRFCRGL